MEIFVIYNKSTGRIDGGSGRIDKYKDEANRDGSTVLEYIERKLSDPDLAVTYLPEQDLPDNEKYKIVKGEIVAESAGPKVVSIKYRPRQHSQRKFGHRQHYSRVKITEIAVG